MLIKHYLQIAALSGAISLASSCSSDDDSSSTAVSSATNVEELKLSSALSLSLPDHYSTSSSSLALSNTKRSKQACVVGSIADEALSQLSEVANMFCHFEVEKDKIEFGKKTHITFSGSQANSGSSFDLWIDNSDSSQLVVYFCEDSTLSQKIVISGSTTTGKAKGSMINQGSSTENGVTYTWKDSIVFDNGYTTDGTVTLTSQSARTESSGGSNKLRVDLNIVNDGVSTISAARKGQWKGDTFEDRGVGKSSSNYAMALFYGNGSHAGESYNYQKVAYFDTDMYKIQQSVSDEFQSGGTLNVSDSDLPEFLADDFSPESFSSSDWDCTGTEVTITLDPDSSEHQACSNRDDSTTDCWDSNTFEDGDDHSA